MADAIAERRHSAKFFCHRCNVEFEDVMQDYTCPFCASGFIEQLEGGEADGSVLSGDDLSDADISTLEDTDDLLQFQNIGPPLLNDLAFIMSGGRIRGGPGLRPESLLEQLVLTIGGGGTGGTVGAPFVLVGAPGDYVLGGEGLDAVVTQLLGQLENSGPPPLPREQIAAIPSENVSVEQAAANTCCSVCWDNLQQGETISRLDCDHIFHSRCIEPWLALHATCPICRRSLLPEGGTPVGPPAAAPDPPQPGGSQPGIQPGTQPTAQAPSATDTDRRLNMARVVVRRLRRWGAPSSSSSTTSSVSHGGVWAPGARSNTNSTTSNSSSSLNSSNDRDVQFNMDIEFD